MTVVNSQHHDLHALCRHLVAAVHVVHAILFKNRFFGDSTF
jgi:hypothetical protein